MSESASRHVVIDHNLGLHLRAAGVLVQAAEHFDCTITIKHVTIIADGKSIMSVLSLGAPCGTQLEIHASGPNANQAVDSLVELIKNNFNLN